MKGVLDLITVSDQGFGERRTVMNGDLPSRWIFSEPSVVPEKDVFFFSEGSGQHLTSAEAIAIGAALIQTAVSVQDRRKT